MHSINVHFLKFRLIVTFKRKEVYVQFPRKRTDNIVKNVFINVVNK